MLKFIFSFFRGDDSGTDLTLDEAYEILENAGDEEDESEVEIVEPDDPKEYTCFNKIGVITAKKDDCYTIDHVYEYKSDTQNLEVGSQVSFTVYTSNSKVNISNVAIQDDWSCQPANQQSSWCTRTLICKVDKREGREVTVIPGDIVIDLNTVCSEFVPIIGDWVDVEAKVEIDENVTDLFGKVLEVQKICPLRPRILEGRIKQWNDKTKTGVIDRVVFFNEEALSSGYVPVIGDKVVTEVIESDQGAYICRALKILPEKQTDKELMLADSFLPEFELTKEGLCVSDNIFIKAKKLRETLEFKMQVENMSKEELILLSVSLPSSNSQCVIIRPTSLNGIKIVPGKSVKFEGLCTVKNMGTTRELVLFSFVSFCIGRWITISLESKQESNNNYEKARNADKGSIMLAKTHFKNNNDSLIRGERFSIAPRFISARLPDYPVPEKLLNVVRKYEGVKRNYDIIEDLRLAKPCLTAALSFNTYEDRFHTLLHLEEIDELLAITSYAQKQTCFIKDGEYMMLEIQNLAEKRPSLMVGDRIIAKDAYDENSTEYEGFIHKVGAKHIYIKFAQMFHDMYQENDLSVIAIASRTSYRRMHQAIGLAIRNLGNSFLFPNKVPNKKPQVNFIYNPYQDEIHTVHKKIEDRDNKRNENKNSDHQIDPLFYKMATSHKRQENQADMKAETENGTSKKLNKHQMVIETLKRHALSQNSNSKTEPAAESQATIKEGFCDNEENLSTTDKIQTKHNSSELGENAKSHLLLEDPDKDQQSKRTNKKRFVNKNSEEYNKTPDMTKPLGPFKLEWYNKSLNYYQKEAVRNIIIGEARPLPYFIFGPPGTGKTVTLVETILQLLRLLPHSRLLVATPSNSAADLMALRLIDSGVLKPGDIIRLVAYRCVIEDRLPVKLIPYCATSDISREGTYGHTSNVTSSGLTLGCNSSVIGRHRVTVGTCSSLGILFTMGFSKGHFTHIIVDEAGQATEPEVMIPLSLLDVTSGQVILAGDPMQLGPVIASKAASTYGLEETFLDRMLSRFPYLRDSEGFPKTGGYDSRLITRLVYNYRSLPDVLVLSSNMFYNRQLIPTISAEDSDEARLLESVKEILPQGKSSKPPAVVFHGVIGENYQTADCPSWFNPNEAGQIFFYVNELYRLGLKSTDIGIISPYIKQVRTIRAVLEEAEFDIPKVGTVEEFQGQEFNVILMTTVRSSENFLEHDLKHKIGFLSNPRRVNVAITRAQALMIIVGNPHLLIHDPHWRNVIKHCIENGAYCGCDLPFTNSD